MLLEIEGTSIDHNQKDNGMKWSVKIRRAVDATRVEEKWTDRRRRRGCLPSTSSRHRGARSLYPTRLCRACNLWREKNHYQMSLSTRGCGVDDGDGLDCVRRTCEGPDVATALALGLADLLGVDCRGHGVLLSLTP